MEKIKFKYHPNIWNMNVFTKNDDGQTSTCQCCEKKTLELMI